MQVDIGIRALEQTMLEPLRLTGPQHLTSRLQRRDIGLLVR